jgi:hypothetical protein
VVEADSEVAGKLEMLCLVFADGDVRGVVEKDIGGL